MGSLNKVIIRCQSSITLIMSPSVFSLSLWQSVCESRERETPLRDDQPIVRAPSCPHALDLRFLPRSHSKRKKTQTKKTQFTTLYKTNYQESKQTVRVSRDFIKGKRKWKRRGLNTHKKTSHVHSSSRKSCEVDEDLETLGAGNWEQSI